MSRNRKIAVATAIATLAVPAAAQAHVTLQPNQAAAGSFTVLDVRVPTERDHASTTKVDVQFPAGFASASYQAVPGWKVRVIKQKLATPIQTDDGPITEGVSRMIWTRTSGGGGIEPGQFQDFPISVQIPGKAGAKLTFKALQTYSNGEIVRWIGAPGSDEPAPQVTVTGAAAHGAAASATHGGMGAGASKAKTGGGSARPAAAASHDGGSDGLSIAALGVGALGLLFGGGAFLASRRRGGRRAPRGRVGAATARAPPRRAAAPMAARLRRTLHMRSSRERAFRRGRGHRAHQRQARRRLTVAARARGLQPNDRARLRATFARKLARGR